MSCLVILQPEALFPSSASAYEQDTHLFLTIWLAEKAGFTRDQAYELSKYDNATDDDPETEPRPFDLTEPAVMRRRLFHFVSSLRLQELRSTAFSCTRNRISAEQYKRIGQYLHALEDTYSHRGYFPRFGHFRDGHGPDKPWSPGKDNSPALTKQMIEEKFGALISLRLLCTNNTQSADETRRAFSPHLNQIASWVSEEERARAPGTRGDRQSPSRWDALIQKLFGDDLRLNPQRLAEYTKWLEGQRKERWGKP